MPDVTTRDIATRDVATRDIATRDINASGSTILYQWNGTGTTATVGDDPTFPTVGDSGNNNRMEFDGSVWSYVNEDEPRFFSDKGYMAEGAATELSGRSADLTNWTSSGTPVVAKDAVGLSGASNEAFTLTDNDGAFTEAKYIDTSVASSTSAYFMVVRINYDASPASYPYFLFRIGGGTQVRHSLCFDQSDGSYNNIETGGSVVSVTRRAGTFDHWELIIKAADNNTNNFVRMQVAPAYNADGGVTGDVATTGSVVIASAELYKDNYSFSPILTTGGTTKTRLADTGATLPFDWSECDAEGSIEFTLTPFFRDVNASDWGIITPLSSSPARLVYFHSGVPGFTLLNDGANINGFSTWSTVGQTVDVKIRWGSSTMRMSVDGVADTSTTYDGSFNPSGLITLFKNLARSAAIKSLTVYSEDKGDDWLTE